MAAAALLCSCASWIVAVGLEAFHDEMDDMGSVPFAEAGLLDGFYGGSHGHGGDYGLLASQLGAGAGASSTSPAILDGSVPLVDAAASAEEATRRKGDHLQDDKAAMALKSHSEAERRRRERINAHLATLRTMVPCSDKVSASVSLSCSLSVVTCPSACMGVLGADAVAAGFVAPARRARATGPLPARMTRLGTAANLVTDSALKLGRNPVEERPNNIWL